MTPVRSVDKMPVGEGGRGPITERLQSEFAAAVRGASPYSEAWLTYVDPPAGAVEEEAKETV